MKYLSKDSRIPSRDLSLESSEYEATTKHLSRDSRIPSRDLNLGSSEYEASQTTNPKHSVYLCIHYGLQFVLGNFFLCIVCYNIRNA